MGKLWSACENTGNVWQFVSGCLWYPSAWESAPRLSTERLNTYALCWKRTGVLASQAARLLNILLLNRYRNGSTPGPVEYLWSCSKDRHIGYRLMN